MTGNAVPEYSIPGRDTKPRFNCGEKQIIYIEPLRFLPFDLVSLLLDYNDPMLDSYRHS